MPTRTTTQRRKTPAEAAPVAPPASQIDYPQEGEKIIPGHYAIRISADATDVEINVSGDWKKCRTSVGFFWYDWQPTPGRYELKFRYRSGKGRWKEGPATQCSVVGAGKN